jgi:DNA-binding NtrC family response regulator
VRGGHLREDLYYRLNVFHVHMPPLRDRREDIPAIAQNLIADLNRKHDRKVTDMSDEVVEALMRHDWPGNVRELRNAMERSVIIAGEGTIQVSHLPINLQTQARVQAAAAAPAYTPPPPSAAPASGDDSESLRVMIGTTVEQAEKDLILRTLDHTKNNKTRAAEILGISLKTLHNKLKEYGTRDALL